MNFPNSRLCCARLEFVGMSVDRQGVRPAEKTIAAKAALPPPSTVEDLRAFLGMTDNTQVCRRLKLASGALDGYTPQQGLRVQTSKTCPDPVVRTAPTRVLVPHVGSDVFPHSSLLDVG